MPIPCEHWTKARGFVEAGRCAIGRYGDPKLTLSHGACLLCLRRQGKPVPQQKRHVRLPVLPPFIVERRAICAECDESTHGAEADSDCRPEAAVHPGRGNIQAGTRRPEAKCRLGKWGPQRPPGGE